MGVVVGFCSIRSTRMVYEGLAGGQSGIGKTWRLPVCRRAPPRTGFSGNMAEVRLVAGSAAGVVGRRFRALERGGHAIAARPVSQTIRFMLNVRPNLNTTG